MPHRDQLYGAEVFDTGVVVQRPEEGGDETDLQGLVRRSVEDALQWREEHLEPEQTKATDYYMGRPFGDEREGRSQVVATEVRDAVQSMLPSLLRVFVGSERVVEFKPDNPEDVSAAKQQTEYVNHIVMEDNSGFTTLHAVLKDALIRKLGVVKYWWEDDPQIEGYDYTGLSERELVLLSQHPDAEVQPVLTQEAEVDEETGQVVRPAEYEATVRREVNKGRVKIAAVPPEEFIFSPDARSREDAAMLGHVRDLPASELRAMGVPDKIIEKEQQKDESADADDLVAARSLDEGASRSQQDPTDEADPPVRFADIYIRVPNDEGLSELRHIQAVGTSCEIFTDYLCDEAPFALFGPDPEPHTLIGLSLSDYVMDLQRIKSAITRGMLDSLSLAINPATEVVEGQVNIKDVLNDEVGRIIRTRQPGQMREVVTPFVGKEAMPVLEYLDNMRQERTGITDASVGLDADALQSSTRAAVSATINAAQQRIEMIARIFAETGMKQLMQGILRLIVQHQDKARMVRLRNEFVEINPDAWNAEKDVTINVALGTGLVEEKIKMLSLVLEKQEQLLQAGAPIIGFAEYRKTLGRLVELAGFQDSNEFFKPFGPREEQAFRQQQAANQKPDETEVFAQIEAAKIQSKEREDIRDSRLEAAKLRLDKAKAEREFALKEAELMLQAEKEVNEARLDESRLRLEKAKADVEGLKSLSETRIGDDDSGS